MRFVVPIVAAATVTLLAAGCGGSSSPNVANLASSTTAATTPTRNSSASELSAFGHPVHGQFQIAMDIGTRDGPKFSACVRRHGVPNFPDPNGQGVVNIHSGMGVDPGPRLGSALNVCQRVLPNGGQSAPAQVAQRQQELLVISACMRAHGIKDFPDPSNGGLRVRGEPGSDTDPSNPTYQRAERICR